MMEDPEAAHAACAESPGQEPYVCADVDGGTSGPSLGGPGGQTAGESADLQRLTLSR
jgi:hypothetical protein